MFQIKWNELENPRARLTTDPDSKTKELTLDWDLLFVHREQIEREQKRGWDKKFSLLPPSLFILTSWKQVKCHYFKSPGRPEDTTRHRLWLSFLQVGYSTEWEQWEHLTKKLILNIRVFFNTWRRKRFKGRVYIFWPTDLVYVNRKSFLFFFRITSV